MATIKATHRPEFDALKSLLLEMSNERSLDNLLKLIALRWSQRPHVAMSRVWLIAPGDICSDCAMRTECPDQTECLHLVASAGSSTNLDGAFRRVPIGASGKISTIAATRESIAVMDIEKDGQWVTDADWVRREEVRGFSGEPIVHDEKVLGVVVMFTKTPLPVEGMASLRILADQAGAAITNARAFESLRHDGVLLGEALAARCDVGALVGSSAAQVALRKQVEMAALSGENVVILGDTGTGKEQLALEIQRRSAHSGRLLGEVSALSAAAQAELARGEVRLIARSKTDLNEEVEAGRFNRELYYRLNVLAIQTTPLHKRKEDIPEVAAHIIESVARRWEVPAPQLSEVAMMQLQHYDWPGNLREMCSVIERALVTSRDGTLRIDLPMATVGKKPAATANRPSSQVMSEDEMRRRERDNIMAALVVTDWHVYGPNGAATLIGVKPTTLASRIKKLEIRPPR